MSEKWKSVPGYEGRYEVSDRGRIRSYCRIGSGGGQYEKPQRIIKGGRDTQGYPEVGLRDATGKRTTLRVHRLVMAAFVGPRPEGMTVNHRDGIKAHNWLGNLEYVSQAENNRHALDLGLRQSGPGLKGETVGTSKLTEAQVLEIRRLYAMGRYLQRELGEWFGVSDVMIGRIVRRRAWTHI